MKELFFNTKTTQNMKIKGGRELTGERDNKYESKYLVGGSASEERKNKQREREGGWTPSLVSFVSLTRKPSVFFPSYLYIIQSALFSLYTIAITA
jgi:hypothetical protein